MNRREFVQSIAAAALLPAVARQGASANEWGSPVCDLHFHLRSQPASNLAHLDGAGVTKANLLTRGAVLEQVQAPAAARMAGKCVARETTRCATQSPFRVPRPAVVPHVRAPMR